jgi:DNA (cytosine-5)-methyltransferase 1
MTQKSRPYRKPPLVSLFSGAGGLDYGFEAAGFETRLVTDFDHDCCQTLRKNRDWTVLEGDIRQIASEEILFKADLKQGDCGLLIGGPPCQPFSKSGYWSRGDTLRLADPRAQTLEEYMRVVESLLPQAFLLENVHGISYSGKEEGLQFLLQRIAMINAKYGTSYSPSWAVLNAAEYGVPQIRTRFFLVADREGRTFRFPTPTHCASPTSSAGGSLFRRPAVTAWDAIGDLDDDKVGEDLSVKGRWGDLLPSIPEGENYLWHTARKGGLPLFGWRRRYWSFLLKLAKRLPSWTIQAQPGPAIGPFHWKNRRLSTEELARLQTFPRNLRYAGGRTSIQRQIGNAVPSLLAEILGRSILEQVFKQQVDSNLVLSIPPKGEPPPPEPVRPVPSKYLHLQGQHPAHPGTGKGYGRRPSAAAQTTPLLLTSPRLGQSIH